MSNGSTLSPERAKTAKAAMRYLASREAHSFLGKHGLTGAPVILAEWDTLVGEVRAMLRAQDLVEAAVILICHPSQEFKTLVAQVNYPNGSYIEDCNISQEAEIGMVWEALRRRKWSTSQLGTATSVARPDVERVIGAYTLTAV